MGAVSIHQALTVAAANMQAGRVDEAASIYRQILESNPTIATAWYELGLIALRAGHNAEAVKALQNASTLLPDNATAAGNLGEALRRAGQLDAAIVTLRRAIQLDANIAATYNNLAIALRQRGKCEEAVTACRDALRLQPELAEAWLTMGNALRGLRRYAEAEIAFRHAIQLRSSNPIGFNNLGIVLREQSRPADALRAFQMAIQLQPDYADAWYNLGNLYRELDQFDPAEAAYRRGLEINGAHAEAQGNLGVIWFAQGRFNEALAAFERAIQLKPQAAWLHNNLIYALDFCADDSMRRSRVAAAQERWRRQFTEGLIAEPIFSGHGDNDPARRLRIGYVSPHFRDHPVCQFLPAVLEAHDRSRVEVYCYSIGAARDAMTDRVKRAADIWRDVVSLDEEALARQIQSDRIDILVDLAQHLSDNRLLVFARKPAPICVAWLGYAGSTGLPAIDYRFTDAFLDPEDAPWSISVETPIRLPDCWFCFNPPHHATGETTDLPASQTGYVQFGSLNSISKIDDQTIRVWAELLHAVKDSRLLMHCPGGSTQTRIAALFQIHGIGRNRLELIARTASRAEYLLHYRRIDIALDPFAYNGGTTTCEAVWMGVPVVSRAGTSPMSRLGLSILSNIGCPEWVASSEKEYIQIATDLAGDLSRLAQLRATLRSRMQSSPLMDVPRFTRNLEAAYRRMWERWCENGPARTAGEEAQTTAVGVRS